MRILKIFDLAKELAKLNIQKIETQKGDICQLGNHRLMCGDSTIEKDILKLMDGEKTDMCLSRSSIPASIFTNQI